MLGGCAAGTALLVVALGFTVVPSLAAGGLLHPARVALYHPVPRGCTEREFPGDGLTLRGWSCAARGPRLGSVVYLHGVADNRSSAVGVIDWLTQRGFDVVAYDSRAHGQSDGSVCTYGFYEKRDLKHVIDLLAPGPVLLLGTSLGGAVAIQGAVGNERVVGVIAAEAFSDLRTIAIERAPRVLPPTRHCSRVPGGRRTRALRRRRRQSSRCRRIVANSCAPDSWCKRCGYAARAFAEDLRGVEGAEAAAARARGRSQSVAQQSRGLGRNRTMAINLRNPLNPLNSWKPRDSPYATMFITCRTSLQISNVNCGRWRLS